MTSRRLRAAWCRLTQHDPTVTRWAEGNSGPCVTHCLHCGAEVTR